MKNDSPPSALRLRPFMMPPSAAADNVIPAECAIIASGCTLSTSPPARGQRATPLDGLGAQRAAAQEAFGGAPGLGIASEGGRHLLLRAAGEARGGAQVAVHLHRLAAGCMVQTVDVLCHDTGDEPAQLEPGQRGVGG